MGSIQTNSDPYNNFASMAYKSKHYPDLAATIQPMAENSSGQPQKISSSPEENMPQTNQRCWNQLEPWHKVLIVGIPLLLI